MNIVGQVDDHLATVENWANGLAMIVLFVLMVLVSLSAMGRYLFNNPIYGVLEVTRLYILPLMVYFSFAMLEREDGNISVELVSSRLPTIVNRVVTIAYLVGALLSFALILYLTFENSLVLLDRNAKIPGPISFPVYVSWFIIPVGLSPLILRYVIKLIRESGRLVDDIRDKETEGAT